MVKVKVGDKVIIKKPKGIGRLTWVSDMDKLIGKPIIVRQICDIYEDEFAIKEDFWWFNVNWITHVNGIPVDKSKPTKQEHPYENWKMSISKDKFVRCITPLVDACIVVEGVYGYVDEIHNKFYYHVYDREDKYIVADVYATDKGYEFVRENKDSGKVSGMEENNDLMDAVTSTREGILASFGLPTDTPIYNPVKNISLEKYQRCVAKAIEEFNYFNQNGELTWMFKSPCENYYYWCDYNSKNESIYFRGDVDWVEKNYRKDNPKQRKKLADLAKKLKGAITKISNDEKDSVIVAEENHEDYWDRVKSSGSINASLEDKIEVVTDPAVYELVDSLRNAVQEEDEYTGGSVNYYKLLVENPTNIEHPYEAECNDIIETLGMNYAEGNAFKAIWRKCAARKFGVKKKGYDNGLYDSEKVVFFGKRMVEQSKW